MQSSRLPIPYHLILLKQEFQKRKAKNPKYSLRAFSRFLGIDHSNLSAILSGKKKLTIQNAKMIGQKLKLATGEKDVLLNSLVDEKHRELLAEINPDTEKLVKSRVGEYLENELYEVMASWYYPAILDLSMTDRFQSSADWIASALGLKVSDTVEAIARLETVGLLKRNKGTLVKASAHVSTRDKTRTTPALKNLQAQVLEKAKAALVDVPIELRTARSTTMAIDPEKLPAAKAMIEDFISELCKFLESGKRSQVYQLALSLFPVQIMHENK